MSHDTVETNGRVFRLIGSGSAVMHIVAFTVLGELVLENIAYGAIVGLFAGAGAFLFLPWFLQLSAMEDEPDDEVPFSEVVDRIDGDTRLSLFGLGLELGGIVMFAVGLSFAEPNFVVGLGVALAIAIVVPLVGSALLR